MTHVDDKGIRGALHKHHPQLDATFEKTKFGEIKGE